MITGAEFAVQAQSSQYTGIPYSKLDCQAFVERVAQDAGIRKPDGSIYNWKGSNSMWRNITGWKGTLQECREQFGSIPEGAWVFIRKTDGGEVDRGYHDNLGNFTHVGIYCKDCAQPVRDSTRYTGRDGVGYRPLKSFTHVLLPDFISYQAKNNSGILPAVRILRDLASTDDEYLKALETLANYLKGV